MNDENLFILMHVVSRIYYHKQETNMQQELNDLN